MPVWIDGRSYRQVLAKTGRIARRLAELDIPTSITDETYLMSVMSGMEPRAFRDAALSAFFSGDTGTLQRLVSQVNAGS